MGYCLIMAIKINGDNTSATPGITGSDADTGISFGTDEVAINTGGVERVKVDSAGDLEVKKTSTPVIRLNQNDTFYAPIKLAGNDLEIRGSSGQIEFYTGANDGESSTERMRVTDYGKLLVGTTSSYQSSGGTNYNCNFVSYTGNEASIYARCSTAGAANVINNEYGSGTRYLLSFDCGASRVGDITSNGSSTTYGTSSDYRLKENVVNLDGAITRVKQLAPKRFNFIADADTTVDGFLAHEAQAVVPEAVTGTHNQVDDDGNPVYQGIDQSKLVPLLTAALQEAIAKIETLETKVAALEAN